MISLNFLPYSFSSRQELLFTVCQSPTNNLESVRSLKPTEGEKKHCISTIIVKIGN